MPQIKNINISVDLLRTRCQKYLRQRFGSQSVIFPDTPNAELPQGKRVHVVLFAHALPVLLEPHLWARDQKYRFWVLSRSHQKMAQKILGFSKVSIIPREVLLKSASRIRPWPRENESSTLVISSSLLPRKNTRLATELAEALHEVTGGGMKLAFCVPGKKDFSGKLLAGKRQDGNSNPKFMVI